MDWTHIMYLPVVMAVFWPMAIFVTKKHPTRAQLLLCAAMLMGAFAITMTTIIFRARTESLFIYQYLFELVAVLVGPVFYIAICSLTEPRGASLRQRHSLILPLLFIVGLSIGASVLGPRRYGLMCHMFRYGELFPLSGDAAWRFTALWSYHVFLVLVVAMNLVLLVLASRKSLVFQRRFNSYYAENIHAPHLHSGPLHLLAWLFLPLAVGMVVVMVLRIPFQKHIIIAVSLIFSLLQFLLGRYTYSLDYDARYLATYVKKNL